ncbi:MAG: alpha/beta hydrolase [Planctomycetota bacterium]|nr:alpha/beta hydrolase [Planctomycetota bacterium]
MPIITTRDHTKLYTKVWGTGRPIVLIHGWPLSADSWDDVAVPLVEAGFQTIAYDRRGFGRSDQPWTGYEYDTLSDDLADVMRELNLEDVTLVGFSMGGGEVARYMSRHQAKGVRSAALIASVVPYMLKTSDNPLGVDPGVFDFIASSIREDRAKFFAAFFKDFYGVGSKSSSVSDEVLEWTHSLAMQGSLRAILACAHAFGMTDFRPDMPSFTVPTLIVHGTGDRAVPIDVSARQASKFIAGSKLIEYDCESHGLFATHRKQLVDDLLAFLR